MAMSIVETVRVLVLTSSTDLGTLCVSNRQMGERQRVVSADG